ncbi:hypothetical protein [Nocardioides alcanivorans]|uniref:hypothetical protein n=1 Tax=Nocardioides alcanivorans TaxID=2897352 RepID=UPI001F25683D|nr:hypothetical protein [Nocardioides alcanivorans]
MLAQVPVAFGEHEGRAGRGLEDRHQHGRIDPPRRRHRRSFIRVQEVAGQIDQVRHGPSLSPDRT